MKIGMNLLLWTGDASGEEFTPVLKSLKEMGYDGVEIPIFDFTVDRFAALGRRLDDLGLGRTGVTVRGDADDPMSPDATVRRAGIDNNKRALDCCAAGGMTVLAGPFHSAIGRFSGKGPTGDEWKRAVESMRETAEHAESCGVTLAVECLNRFECYLLNTAADGHRFVQDVNHPRCRMMYDTFHAHIEEKDPAEAIRASAPSTVHVHISENDRSTPGAGQVKWKETFDALAEVGYDGWLTVEAFGQALPELAAATKIWRKMFRSELDLAADALAFIRSELSKRS